MNDDNIIYSWIICLVAVLDTGSRRLVSIGKLLESKLL